MDDEKKLQELIKKATPLTEASYYILISLKEPLHGYGVMQKVDELSQKRVQLGPGTLYGALSNLQTLGLIEAVGESASERRKLYCMTESGRMIAEHEVIRFEELARHGRMLLGM
ncbi:MAG: PadR family transcriptional regulator [Chloroflexi bacterium HGW-Chloroflexi-4]|jgi:DNA-binding PadR family transcriptional regulator|nr:MAG: PadR family transcriptional regulator [Chloroflexi bacterium HGW-Chloroflexi-4]